MLPHSDSTPTLRPSWHCIGGCTKDTTLYDLAGTDPQNEQESENIKFIFLGDHGQLPYQLVFDSIETPMTGINLKGTGEI